MKKIILILVLVLPVVVTVLIYMVAGFIVREMNVPFLTAVRLNHTNLNAQSTLVPTGENYLIIRELRQGDRIRLNNYIIPVPSRVPFSTLSFEIIYGGGNQGEYNNSLRIEQSGNNVYLVAYRPFANPNPDGGNDFQGRGVEVRILGTGGTPLSTIFVEDVIA
ncbi:MAG: hypothetical protein FWE01_03060 [Firmicutes bacterium]|nr:hypothetical protein [Bacillota bacterium]